jgi:hypothetical protein
VSPQPLDSESLRAHLFNVVRSTTLTALSGFRRVASPRWPIYGLARESHMRTKVLFALALGCSVATTGCLVADAPTYGPPEQRPPVINSQGVKPTPYALIVVPDPPVGVDITVPVRSEDAGESLWGALYVDYGLEKEKFWDDKPIAPGSFDELDRSYDTTFQWDARVTSGCHTLTALITHASNWDNGNNLVIDSSDFDVSSVTWWMNVKPTNPSMPGVLEGCPTTVVAP